MRKLDLATELCLAVIKPDPQQVEQLISQGTDVDALGDRRIASVSGSTPLWLAANLASQEISEDWGQLCEGLTELFPSFLPRDHATKRAYFIRIAEMLIKSGADLNKLAHGSVPLAQAILGSDSELVQLLLSHGANPNAESFSILSKLAKREGRKTVMGYFNTALHTAVEKDAAQIVQALLSAGADPNRRDHEGKTPLDIARGRGNKEIVAVLEKAVAKR